MDKKFWPKVLSSCSDNLKSKIKNRKWAGLFVVVAILSFGVITEAQQQGKTPRIGVLNATSAASLASRMELFRQGLRGLGYIDGQNIVIEYRYADGKLNQLPDLAAELVRLNVAVIVAGGGQSVRAAKNATNVIPIVMTQVVDPMDFVANLAKPGGNITGLSAQQAELGGKRLELLKEMVSRLSVVAVLGARDSMDGPEIKEIKLAGRAMGLQLQSVEIPRSAGPNDLEKVFSAISKGRSNGLFGLSSPEFSLHRRRIAELAVKHRLPSVYRDSEFPDAGGLMSYGAQYADLYRRAAIYVDKILKGTKPADLPVEQPTKFEFIINLKTAKQIGLTIPPNVLARADRVIR
jgi:putative tryptophan/tyrosine transport system substrate-binding protein